MRQLRCWLLTAVACAALTACGDDEVPAYDGATACGVDTATVADVLGTKAFTVENNQDTFPIDDRDGPYRCNVFADHTKPDLTIEVELDDQLGADTVGAAVERFGAFEVVGGTGKGAVQPQDADHDDQVEAIWVCGSVTGRVRATVDEWDAAAARTLTQELAEAAGCAA